MPKVSIMLTSYNHQKYIRRAIDSVLAQTFEDFELLVFDDGSTDDSWSIIKSYKDKRIKAIRAETNSAGKAIFTILRGLSGDLLAVHHSDDVWGQDKLRKQVAYLESNSDCAAVFTDVAVIDENGADFQDREHFYYNIFHQQNRTRHQWLNRFFYKGNCLCHPSALIRRAVLDEVGNYNGSMFMLVDFDLWVRICLKHEVHVIQEKLTKFTVRDNDQNMSGSTPRTHIIARFETLIY